MQKIIGVVVTLLLSSNISLASEVTNQSTNENKKEQSLFEKLFTPPTYRCETFPDCDIDESEQMARDAEMQKRVYQDPKAKTKEGSDKK